MTKRAETILIAFLLLIFAVSFFTTPLFPVQRYPLFADAPTQYEVYRAYTPSGEEIPVAEIQLQNTYDGDPTFYVGRLPQTAYKWGHILTQDELRQHLLTVVEVTHKYPELCLQRMVWGLGADHKFGVTKIDHMLWTQNGFSLEGPDKDLKCGRADL